MRKFGVTSAGMKYRVIEPENAPAIVLVDLLRKTPISSPPDGLDYLGFNLSNADSASNSSLVDRGGEAKVV